jgi:hypothetical protein
MVRQTYNSPDEAASMPFPNEHSLQITIPADQVRAIGVETDLPEYLNDPQQTPLPIIKLTFSENISPALILSFLLPRRLMEAAMLKIRYYLQNHNNKEYMMHKLMPQFTGKETLLRDMFRQVETQPLDCLHYLETGGEFAVLFWLYFCNMVKSEIRRKDELLAEDIAAFQSVFIINVLTVYYKKKVMLEKEKEMAFFTLEQRLGKAPFFYSMNDITQFTGANGQSLLGQYSEAELGEYLKRKTTESNNQELPELLIFHTKNNEQLFIYKNKVLPLYAKLLGDIRPQIQQAITTRWQNMLREFRHEAAMDQDQDFEKLVETYVNQLAPTISLLAGDKRLHLIYTEIEHSQGIISESSMIFTKTGVLMPLAALLLLKRRDLLIDARFLLPFWYSIPILTAIIMFFYNLKQRKQQKYSNPEKNSPNGGDVDQPEMADRAQRQVLQAVAREYKSVIVPLGYTPDKYLEELENRWRKLLDREGKKILVEDVKSLVRDKLRRFLRQRKQKRITPKTFVFIADSIMMESPALEQLDARESVHLYIQLYLIQLIENMKM